MRGCKQIYPKYHVLIKNNQKYFLKIYFNAVVVVTNDYDEVTMNGFSAEVFMKVTCI